MNDALVTIERLRPEVATLTLNRPDKYNALSRALMEEIAVAARSFRDDSETKVVIVRGAGKHFSAGADLVGEGVPEVTDTKMRLRYRAGHEMAQAVRNINQITIAATQGYIVGGAGVLALACDFRIGSTDAQVGFPEIDLGMNMNWHSVPPLVRLVGESRAKQLYIGGRYHKAEQMLQWGFFDEICEREELLDKALEWAEFYATKPPIATEMIKRSINAWAGQSDQAVMHADGDQWVLASMTDDFQTAMKNFYSRKK